MKDYFKEIYEELLVELEEVNLELYESIQSAIDFRNKLLKLSTYIKSLTKIKVDAKKAVL